MVLFAARGNGRSVIEVARWVLVRRPVDFCHRSRSGCIGIQRRWRHWAIEVPRFRVLGRRAWSGLEALGSRISSKSLLGTRMRSRRLL
jgi:hypothetical protein